MIVFGECFDVWDMLDCVFMINGISMGVDGNVILFFDLEVGIIIEMGVCIVVVECLFEIVEGVVVGIGGIVECWLFMVFVGGIFMGVVVIGVEVFC